MKILQICTHASITRGGAVQLYRLARELLRRGHDVTCVFHAWGGQPAPDDAATLRAIEEAGARLVFYDMIRWRSILEFRRFLARERFDAIHSHRDLALEFVTLATLFGPRPPVFVANRGSTYRLRRFSLTRWCYRRAALDRVIAVADAVKDVVVRTGGLPPEKVDVIYGSVDTKTFDPARIDAVRARAAFGVPPGARVVGAVATWSPKKGYDYFFNAAAEILREMDRRGETERGAGQAPLFFLAVGRRVERKMADLIETLGIRDRTILPGHCEDVPSALAAMDVFVVASTKGEGLTGTIREAMAMRKPVVSTDVSGNREIVQDGVTGLLVPTRDSEALARAVLSLLDDPARAARLAQAGYELVQSRFTDAIRGDRIEALYLSIAAAKTQEQAIRPLQT